MKLTNIVKRILQEQPDVNDPALVALRAKKDQVQAYGKKPSAGAITRWYDALDKLYSKLDDVRELEKELFADMDSDPDMEVEGGPVADKYGTHLDQLNDISVKVRLKIKEYEDKIQKYKQTFSKK